MNRIAILGLLLLLSMPSFAHRLDFAIKAEGDDFIIQAWFDENRPVNNGDVSIISADGSELDSGTTDEQGLFRWSSPQVQDITIKIYAGLGHKISREITAAELQALAPDAIGLPSTPAHAPVQDSIPEATKTSAILGDQTPPSASLYTTQNQFGTLERMVLGFVFLISATTAWISYRNSKKLMQIEEWLKRLER